ncbi:acyltransferase [Saccharopolyspora shandongensis]|uniref:acyltransferase n=1 Tax=Saccharopolyspora shandongensis TaxID=418495 RepID=UPI00343658AA
MGSWREARNRWALPATAGSAVLFFFGTGLAPVAALTWLAPLPVLLIAPRVSGVVAATAAFAACFLGTTNLWGWSANSHDLPLLPGGLLVTAAFGLTFALAVLVFRGLLRRGRALLAALAGPAVWVGVLYLVSVSNPMGIMGTLATTQADVPVVLQVASVTGAWGIDYLVLLVPAALAAVLAPAVSTGARVRTGTVAVVLLVAALGGGALRLASEPGPAQRVALVASNQKGWAADLGTPDGRDLLRDYLARLAELPRGVQTVVLPEGAFGSTEAQPAVLVEPMGRLARERGFDIVVGFAHWDGGAKYNYALTFPARGGGPVPYLKQHDTVSPAGRELVFPPVVGARLGVEICMDVTSGIPAATTPQPALSSSRSRRPTKTPTAGSTAARRCCAASRTAKRSPGAVGRRR